MDSGFAEQDVTTNHYGLGREALQVGLAALGQLDVLKIAAPHLVALRDQLNETCFLAVWGKNDPFFLPPGAEAFKLDVQDAEVRFVDSGHFALETHAHEIGAAMLDFLAKHLG